MLGHHKATLQNYILHAAPYMLQLIHLFLLKKNKGQK